MQKKGRGKGKGGRNLRGGGLAVAAVSNPEFVKEGAKTARWAMILGFILLLVVIALIVWAVAGYENYDDSKKAEKKKERRFR